MSSQTAALSGFLSDRALAMLDDGIPPKTVGETFALWAAAHLVESADYAEMSATLSQYDVTLPSAAQAGAVYATRISREITASGEYDALDDGAYGYTDVTVAIEHPSKTFATNGTYHAANDGCEGWGEVVVDTAAYTIVSLPASVCTDASMTITTQAYEEVS